MSVTDIRTVVIVGGGTAGWMTASAMSRYLNNGRRKIVLVESDAIGTVGVGEATIPPIRNFNQMLDIDENEFLRETRATFKLGIEFVNWGKKGDRYFHPFGTFGTDIHGIDFHQLFLREHARKGSGIISDFSMSCVAASLNRFGRPSATASAPLSEMRYAFHFDASRYAAFLKQYAVRNGVRRIEGRIASVDRHAETGDVTQVVLENGEAVAGDLFIDCSGFRGLLIEDALETGYEDWSHWLPVDRAIALPSRNVGSPAPFTRSTAHDAGWQWRIPLQHRTGNGHVYCSDHTDDDMAERTLRENLEGEAIGDARLLRFSTGMRRKAWNHNVVAIGLSSGFLEPLESTSIHLIQNGISRLFALFPDNPISGIERDEYNRGMRELFEDVRDFIILHYKATQRDDTEFWRTMAAMDIPETLERKIAIWRLHGRIFRENAELFTAPSWIAVMLGQNIWPSRFDPVADTLDESRVSAAMQQMRESYRNTAQSLPTQESFLREAGAWAADSDPLVNAQ